MSHSALRLVDLRETPLDVAEVVAALDDDAAGGLTLFIGRVRDHDGGRGVDGLDYSAHPTALARLTEAGVDVLILGVLPTPGVAFLTGSLGADFGVVISASHNPMPDNGIKFLARGGVKLDDAVEITIERRLHEHWDRPTGGDVGRVSTYHGTPYDVSPTTVLFQAPSK